jgi:rRNA maturation RNase YbeY
MVRRYVSDLWTNRELPSGVLSIVFVGSRKARALAKEYLKEDQEHPVLTFPYIAHEQTFPQSDNEGVLLGEIVVCYPQVTLYAAEQDKEINKVIMQFLDHAINILAQEFVKHSS